VPLRYGAGPSRHRDSEISAVRPFAQKTRREKKSPCSVNSHRRRRVNELLTRSQAGYAHLAGGADTRGPEGRGRHRRLRPEKSGYGRFQIYHGTARASVCLCGLVRHCRSAKTDQGTETRSDDSVVADGGSSVFRPEPAPTRMPEVAGAPRRPPRAVLYGPKAILTKGFCSQLTMPAGRRRFVSGAKVVARRQIRGARVGTPYSVYSASNDPAIATSGSNRTLAHRSAPNSLYAKANSKLGVVGCTAAGDAPLVREVGRYVSGRRQRRGATLGPPAFVPAGHSSRRRSVKNAARARRKSRSMRTFC